MVSGTILATGAIIALASRVAAHACPWHPSMWGFNITDTNRPQEPLMNLPFDQWWFHGHLDHPPHPEDIMQLPVGGEVDLEISCDKDATSYWTSGPGGDQRDKNNPNYPCPGQPTTEFHTNGINDLGGCALGVAYESDVSKIKPEDFTIFSVNHTCVWYLHTSFSIPEQMPKCPDGKCTCAWFWIHKADSGSEQMYMNGFQCNMEGAVSTTPLPPAQVARRCGDDPDLGHPANPANCTYGPKQPLYWYQKEGNNMFEGTYTPPLYNDLYNFRDGAQNDIFQPGNSSTQPSGTTTTTSGTPTPTPVLDKTPLGGAVPSSSSSSTTSSSSPPAPPPSSPAPPSSSSPAPPPSSLPAPPSSSSPAPPPSSSPAPPPSSPPAGGPSTSQTSSTSTSTTHSSPHPPPPSTPTHKEHTPKPDPKNGQAHQPEHKPKHKTCKHRPKPTQSSGQSKDHGKRENIPAPRQLSSIGDSPVRRVWGHRRRNVDRRDA
ncbi:hypothetical protein EDB87DRAFT_923260 [Lactarius vividus]|nr:hypothetical protein EDB87DRAFT_923260 [Lactarius vividus]